MSKTEREAERRILEDLEKRRNFEDRRFCLHVSEQTARDPADTSSVLLRAECMYRWLNGVTVH